MAIIGILTRRPDGAFSGTLAIKSYGGRIFLQPLRKTTDAAPDFRLYGVGDNAAAFEAGAAWTRTKQGGQAGYIWLKIDFPELVQPIYAVLGEMAGQDDPDVFAVTWNRAGGAGGDPFASLAAGLTAGGAAAASDLVSGASSNTAPSHPDDPFVGLDPEDAARKRD